MPNIPPELLAALQQQVNQKITPSPYQPTSPQIASLMQDRSEMGIPNGGEGIMQKLALLRALNLLPSSDGKPLSTRFAGSILQPSQTVSK